MQTQTNSFQIFAESQAMVSFIDNPVKSRGASRGGEKGDYPPLSLSLSLPPSVEVYIHRSSPTLRGIVVLVFTKSDR